MINLVTTNQRFQNAQDLLNDISNSNNYYFFVGNYVNSANSSTPLYDITSNTVTQAWTNMLMGIQLNASDVAFTVSNIPWTINNVYGMYDDIDTNLPSEQFFVITKEGAYYHFWKCLYNNFAVASTVQPLVAYANQTPYFQTADGYRWKYMTSINQSLGTTFQTSNSFPIVANSIVTSAAIPGALDIFVIESQGAFYNNYLNSTFLAADLNKTGNPNIFNLSSTSANTTNGFYTGCLIYLTGGTGLGQYSTITDYTSNSTGNFITTANTFFPAPQNGTVFQITPQLRITSDGLQTINCVARALVNSLSSNSIYSIESLQPGQNYINVTGVTVVVNSVVGSTNNAIVRAVASPPGGHGANVFTELYCNSIVITAAMANSENNTILTTNFYQQIGIMNNPLFANVNIILSSINGTFTPNETIYSFIPSQLNANVVMTQGQSNITCNTANFINQLTAGQFFFMSGQFVSQLFQVNAVSNSSLVIANTVSQSTTNSAIMYAVDITGNAIFANSTNSTSFFVNNCTPTFLTGTYAIGAQSGAFGIVSNIVRNGTNEFFQSFMETFKYTAILNNGVFQQGEQLIQGNNTGYLFATTGNSNNITMYVTNFNNGPFVSGGTVIGANSGASATLSVGYNPDILFESGNILYLENINPVTRANTQTETFQITCQF